MKFFCVVNSRQRMHNRECYEYLKLAAEKKNIDFVTLAADELTSSDLLNVETSKNDIIYKVGIDDRSRVVEGLLLSSKNPPKSLHRAQPFKYSWSDSLRMIQAGLPVIESVYFLKDFSRAELQEKVDQLGGYPIILKRTGLSHGAGVSLAQNASGLQSKIKSIGKDELVYFSLRRFIKDYRHARIIVLGDNVVGSLEYIKPNNDFRTNATNSPNVKLEKFSKEVNELAIQAVKCRQSYFGGVDILIDRSGKARIAEVNYPCNFARYQKISDDDTAGKIIDFLVDLAKNE